MHKLSFLAVVLGAALSTGVLAQAYGPSGPAPQPSTGTGATPGGIPPATTTPSPGGAAGGPSSRVQSARGPMDFNAIDTDGDGFISRAEASRAGVGGPFTTLDKNNDGRLDRSEFSAYRGDVPGTQSGAPPTTGNRTQ